MKCQLDFSSIPGIFVFRSQKEQERSQADKSSWLCRSGGDGVQSGLRNSGFGAQSGLRNSGLHGAAPPLPSCRGSSAGPLGRGSARDPLLQRNRAVPPESKFSRRPWPLLVSPEAALRGLPLDSFQSVFLAGFCQRPAHLWTS